MSKFSSTTEQLESIKGEITLMRSVIDQQMRLWLNEHCGLQGVDWRFKPRLNVFENVGNGIEVKIIDKEVAMHFKLKFIDYLNENVDSFTI